MSLPQIAIVGRPNVGKSSLLNRLSRRRVSIVDPTPGVTRDRVSVMLELEPPLETPRGTPEKLIELVDTGGYGVYTADGQRYNEIGADLSRLTGDIERQIAVAIEQSCRILFVIDAQTGLTSLDETIATLLRKRCSPDKVIVVANKVDSPSWEAHGLDASSLGFGEPICISATSGLGERDLLDAMYEAVPLDDAMQDGDAEIKIAIVGKRNAGKSTLINALAGEPRVIVSEIAGTTRDAIDVRIEINGRSLIAIDTAGVRKRKSMAGSIEYYAYDRMMQSIRRADVVMLLIDATEEVSSVDKKLADQLIAQAKPTVLVINKWDLVNDIEPEQYLEYLTQQLRGLEFAPIVFVSASEGEGLVDAISLAFNLYKQAGHRVSTGKLNKIVEEILDRRGPTSRLGTQAKLLYASQVTTHPPTIILVVNQPKLFRGQYERYLMNRLREALPFSEIPFRVMYRKRQRISLNELKTRPSAGKSAGEPGGELDGELGGELDVE